MKGYDLLLAVLVALLVAGCAHVLSRDALMAVDPEVDFAQIKADPEAYRGKTLLLGGLIVDVRINREGTTLELLRHSLDRFGEPYDVDEAGGRFLARSEHFLDPEIYRPGLLVTLTGTVLGMETRSLKGVDYVYPLFGLGELHIWRRSYYPYYYYDPYYPWPPYYPFYRYPYRYSPYRFRPHGRL